MMADPQSGSLLVETLIAIAVLSAATLAAGMAVANAVSVGDRANRATQTVDSLRADIRASAEAANTCAAPEAASAPDCMIPQAGWTASGSAPLAAHPVLTDPGCRFDFVSRTCRGE